MDPKLISVAKACDMIGIGRTKFYQLVGTELTTVKIGRRRLVTLESLERFVINLAELDQGQSPNNCALYSHVGRPIKPIDPSLTHVEDTDAEIGHIIFSRNNTDGEK